MNVEKNFRICRNTINLSKFLDPTSALMHPFCLLAIPKDERRREIKMLLKQEISANQNMKNS
jgi:hypothetical protein